MRYKIWIEDSQKMTRKIRFDLQFFVPHRLRLMMVADTTPLNMDLATPQGLYLSSLPSKHQNKATHKQHIKQNKHTNTIIDTARASSTIVVILREEYG
jgi:hypothetical protein